MNANFRLPEKIETYGALFNIDYASKVLKQYSTKRYQLDNKLSDEVFLTNVISGIRWVKQFENVNFGNAKTIEIYSRFIKTIHA